MGSFIPALLQCTATLMSMISAFGSQMHPSSPLACSRAVVPVTSNSDNCCVCMDWEGIALLRVCSSSELLQLGALVHQSGTRGVDGSLSEVEAQP